MCVLSLCVGGFSKSTNDSLIWAKVMRIFKSKVLQHLWVCLWSQTTAGPQGSQHHKNNRPPIILVLVLQCIPQQPGATPKSFLTSPCFPPGTKTLFGSAMTTTSATQALEFMKENENPEMKLGDKGSLFLVSNWQEVIKKLL